MQHKKPFSQLGKTQKFAKKRLIKTNHESILYTFSRQDNKNNKNKQTKQQKQTQTQTNKTTKNKVIIVNRLSGFCLTNFFFAIMPRKKTLEKRERTSDGKRTSKENILQVISMEVFVYETT